MRFWIPLVAAAIAVPAYVLPAQAEVYQGTVTDVQDVSTLHVTINGQSTPVKLIGVGPARFQSFDWSQRGRDHARAMLLGRQIQVNTDVQARDQYGRLLGWVFLNGALVNQTLIRDGMAVVAPESINVRYAGNLLQAQQDATRSGAGVWNPNHHLPSPTPFPTPTPTWTPTPPPTWTPTPTPSPWVSPRPLTEAEKKKAKQKAKQKDHKKGKGHEKSRGRGHDKHNH
ncbi:MAG: thermonuclease family protein [Candidatus Sericytochromatia bacterium]